MTWLKSQRKPVNGPCQNKVKRDFILGLYVAYSRINLGCRVGLTANFLLGDPSDRLIWPCLQHCFTKPQTCFLAVWFGPDVIVWLETSLVHYHCKRNCCLGQYLKQDYVIFAQHCGHKQKMYYDDTNDSLIYKSMHFLQ